MTFIFHMKIILNSNFFKMSSVQVHFSPGFPLGEGFPIEQNTHVVLCVNRIQPEQKTSFLRCHAYFEYRRSKNQTVCSPGNPPLRKSEYRRSSSLQNTLLQRAVELCRSNLSFPLTTTLEQIALREILLLEEIQG
jgi:hypothetical protein